MQCFLHLFDRVFGLNDRPCYASVGLNHSHLFVPEKFDVFAAVRVRRHGLDRIVEVPDHVGLHAVLCMVQLQFQMHSLLTSIDSVIPHQLRITVGCREHLVIPVLGKPAAQTASLACVVTPIVKFEDVNVEGGRV